MRTLASGTGRRILFLRTKHHAKRLARDLTAAGMRALRYYLRRERGDVRRALCAYTGRRQCGAEAVAWAR